MNHNFDEQQLLLYYYDDGLTSAERREIEAALSSDAALAARYAEVCNGLGAIRQSEPEALPADMLARFHDTVDRGARMERNAEPARKPKMHFLSFFGGAAITAAIALGIGIGVWLGGTNETGAPIAPPTLAANPQQFEATPAVFQRSMQNFLRASEREVQQLPVDAEGDRLLLIARLIEQNRLFERAATENDSPDLARVLRAFEPILIELASDDIEPAEAAALRSKLAFELNVMLTKLSRDSSHGQETTTERT